MAVSAPAPRNRTLRCSPEEFEKLATKLLKPNTRQTPAQLENQLIIGDIFEIVNYLPSQFVDLLILDPPYNLTKDYNESNFKQKSPERYSQWFQALIVTLKPLLKPNATVYVCSDWQTSNIVFPVLESVFFVRNRITWEREKGRGAKTNWKNNTEDIWFCTNSKKYYFNVEAVKLKRKVIAPYRTNGQPKDWQQEGSGNFRLTHPSNIWTDITVPFWSMSENTSHPTQKPEKLFAKLVLASSQEGDLVFDPFVGSGTSAVVAEKLNRRWCGIDTDTEYLCWALKRLNAARNEQHIQGYDQGVFWERNTQPTQP
ncbi:MAG: site-specific DNA-methyltransferase [Gammaproteobacteria bacterium]|nr:site-specific DNA-methyltransferase [Gammaproteobacteria bacterium]MYK43854.1 site-specific DNA-methyltransferase [Gammaproteobacteria bacterium]